MKKITIRELHMRTGEWVRKAAREEKIIITERGHPVATLNPFEMKDLGIPFNRRKRIPAFERLPVYTGDSTQCISEDRNRW